MMQKRVVPMKALAELIALQLKDGGRAELTVTGCSMLPMLHDRRDSVTLIPVTAQQKPGDVILYRRESGQYVLHRIIDMDADGYICSGDNQIMREPVAHSQLLAVVEAFTRNGKHYTVSSPGYRVYTGIWVRFFFARKQIAWLLQLLGKVRRKIRKLIKFKK